MGVSVLRSLHHSRARFGGIRSYGRRPAGWSVPRHFPIFSLLLLDVRTATRNKFHAYYFAVLKDHDLQDAQNDNEERRPRSEGRFSCRDQTTNRAELDADSRRVGREFYL